VILLNKIDLVSSEQVDSVETVVRGINPTLRVYRTTKSQIDLKELFDLRAYTAAPPLSSLSTLTVKPSCCNGDKHEGHDHHHHSVHNSGITTVLIPLPTLSEQQHAQLNDFLEQLLWKGVLPRGGNAPEILRCKGYIKLQDGRELVLQGVTDLFELKEVASKNEEAQVEGKVVFIGRRVDEGLASALQQQLAINTA
jgi:G3E family GTPase